MLSTALLESCQDYPGADTRYKLPRVDLDIVIIISSGSNSLLMHSWARARHDASTYKYIHSSWFLAANSGHSRNSLIAVNDICKASTSYRSKPNTVEHRWHVCFDSTYLLCFNSGLSCKSLEFAHVHYPCTASHHCINNFSRASCERKLCISLW